MHGYSYEYVELWNTFSRETRGYPTELWPHSAASPKRGGAFHRNRPPHFRTTPNLTSDTSVQKRGRNYECAGLIRGGARFVAASNKKKKRKNRISPYSATPLSSPRLFSTFDLASLPAQCRPDLRCSYFISSDSEDKNLNERYSLVVIFFTNFEIRSLIDIFLIFCHFCSSISLDRSVRAFILTLMYSTTWLNYMIMESWIF